MSESGNWQVLLSEYRHLIGSRYQDEQGHIYNFFGLVEGADDYYYGMYRPNDLRLLSCVGSIEGHGYKLTDQHAIDPGWQVPVEIPVNSFELWNNYITVKTENEELREKLISGFYEEEKPTFRQGEPMHELEELVTAEEVGRYVDEIERLYKRLRHPKNLIHKEEK